MSIAGIGTVGFGIGGRQPLEVNFFACAISRAPRQNAVAHRPNVKYRRYREIKT